MKRILTALLAITMVLSLAACGTTNETTNVNNSTESKDIKITIEDPGLQNDPVDDTESSSEVITTTTETTVPEEPEVPEETPVMTVEPTLVMNGCMSFKCDGKNYVYNITDNELYETEYDVNDITMLNGCVAIVGDISYTSFDDDYSHEDHVPYVVNLKTHELYEDIRPFNCNVVNNENLVVGKYEEAFSGATTYMGMLNRYGEWVMPLSDEHAICKVTSIEKTSNIGQNSDMIYVFIREGANGRAEYYYDIAKDKLLDLGTMSLWAITNNNVIISEYNWNNGLNSYNTLYTYDIANDEKKLLIEKVLEDFRNDDSIKNNSNIYMTDNVVSIYDCDHNYITDYDLDEYSFGDTINYKNILDANENAIVFNTKNASNDLYTVILNKDGNTVCEPVMGDIGMPYFSENKIVFVSDDADRIIDINTGEITEYDSAFDIIDYDDTNDLMLVNTNGSYYLVDPEAPDTLINPFEKVNG
ncbi:hypothetical protein J6A31_04945 [bacterium]|nr:hypothetical protein [bacterium]